MIKLKGENFKYVTMDNQQETTPSLRLVEFSETARLTPDLNEVMI